jgi:hypothetical protein
MDPPTHQMHACLQLPFLEVLGFEVLGFPETPFRYVICLRAREAREDSIGGLSVEIVHSFLLFCGCADLCVFCSCEFLFINRQQKWCDLQHNLRS